MSLHIGRGEWFKAQKPVISSDSAASKTTNSEFQPDPARVRSEFHPDPTKETDPAEELLRRRSPEDAIAELERKLTENPQDTETLRQLNLIRNRLQDLLGRINRRIQH